MASPSPPATRTSANRGGARNGKAIRLAILAGILIAVNILASRFHYGLDLTRERRFTLSGATTELLRGMDDVAVVEVYLVADDLPAGFKRLADAARERLRAFSERSATRIIYQFVDPFEGKSTPDERAVVYSDLAGKGIEGMNLQVGGTPQEGYSEKIIFPWAIVRYKGREAAVNLLERRQGYSSLAVLNHSEGMLEYKLASTIHRLSKAAPASIAYLAGHGEAFSPKTLDFLITLSQRYRLDTFDITQNPYIPSTYDAVIVGGPTVRFDDKEKFKIDQYVMYGGNVLWLVDAVRASLDSLKGQEVFMANPSELNLDDQLFRYGARINADLIEDVDRNLPIPLVVGAVGGRAQVEPRPWPFFPVLEGPADGHPVVANLGGVAGLFVSSIDTIASEGVKKTILLESGQYSRVAPSPVRVNLNSVKFQQRRELFNKPYRPAAVLLEGNFQSLFTDRLPPSVLQVLRDSIRREFAPASKKPSRMIVVADGDVHQNSISRNLGVLELGLWEYNEQQYANKIFLLNALEYLTDPVSPLEARSKQLTLRLLDRDRARKERTMWQAINLGVPLGLLLIFASAYIFFRKRRYESPQS